MSFFITWAANTTLVNYMGIFITVPNAYLEDGYLATDLDGSIWIYTNKPKKDVRCWHTGEGHTEAQELLSGFCILELDNYRDVIKDLGSELRVFEDHWKDSCIKLSECPVIKY